MKKFKEKLVITGLTAAIMVTTIFAKPIYANEVSGDCQYGGGINAWTHGYLNLDDMGFNKKKVWMTAMLGGSDRATINSTYTVSIHYKQLITGKKKKQTIKSGTLSFNNEKDSLNGKGVKSSTYVSNLIIDCGSNHLDLESRV